MAGRFAAEVVPGPEHLFEHVPVPDGRPLDRNAAPRKGVLKPEVRHQRSDDSMPLQFLMALIPGRGGEENMVAVSDAAILSCKDRPVGIAVKSHAQGGMQCGGLSCHKAGMKGAAVEIDVAAVGTSVENVHLDSKFIKEHGYNARGRTVGAVHNQRPVRKRQVAGKQAAQVGDVLTEKFRVGGKVTQRFDSGIEMIVFNGALEFEFLGVRKLQPGIGKNFDPVVVVRIVRCRDHNPSSESVMPREEGHTRSCDDACVKDPGARRYDSSSKDFGNPSA